MQQELDKTLLDQQKQYFEQKTKFINSLALSILSLPYPDIENFITSFNTMALEAKIPLKINFDIVDLSKYIEIEHLITDKVRDNYLKPNNIEVYFNKNNVEKPQENITQITLDAIYFFIKNTYDIWFSNEINLFRDILDKLFSKELPYLIIYNGQDGKISEGNVLLNFTIFDVLKKNRVGTLRIYESYSRGKLNSVKLQFVPKEIEEAYKESHYNLDFINGWPKKQRKGLVRIGDNIIKSVEPNKNFIEYYSELIRFIKTEKNKQLYPLVCQNENCLNTQPSFLSLQKERKYCYACIQYGEEKEANKLYQKKFRKKLPSRACSG